jgi:RNA polymerase sigma factor (sigma-70 family)
MGHSIGDGIIVAALAVAFLGYLYFKQRERRHRLEVVHQERLAAMDKGIPLPELPLDPPPRVERPIDRQVPLILGIILTALGAGTMIALLLFGSERPYWAFGLPLALMGVGLMPSGEPDAHQRLEDARRGRALAESIAQLPEVYQSALRLHYWMGTGLNQIATLIGVPENTVKSYLHRARRLLHAMLGERGFSDV